MAVFTAIGTALGATLFGSAALAGAAVVGAAALAGGSLYMQAQANRQQARMAQFQKRQADLNAAKQRRDTIRANRLASSQALLNANAQGVSNSSGAMGGQDSIRAQGYSNLSFLDTMNTLSDQASKAYGKAISASNTAGMLSSLSSLVGSFYGMSVPASKSVGIQGAGNNVTPGAHAPIVYKGSSPYRTGTHTGSTTMYPSFGFGFQTNNPRG